MSPTNLTERIGAKYSVTQSSSVANGVLIISLVFLQPLNSTPASRNLEFNSGNIFVAISSCIKRVSMAPQIPYL